MADKLIHFLLSDEIIKRIDDFRFSHRFESRAAAIRALLENALDDAEAIDIARKEPTIPFDQEHRSSLP